MSLYSFTDPGSFRCSESGTISGEFYLGVDDAFFPEERWNDLVLPMASAWLHAIQNLLNGTSWRQRVRFMDGPFWADLAMTKEGVVAVKLVESRLRGDLIRHSVEVDPSLLLQDALAMAIQVLEECRARGWRNSDAVALARQLREARTRQVGNIQ
ncbi:MAG: hypothetical protein JNK87_40605 [Bryobacterales bacterium]|nr:hypothetical protein [Bryobacterales bacterium]